MIRSSTLTIGLILFHASFAFSLPSIGWVEKATIFVGTESAAVGVDLEVKVDTGARTSSLDARDIRVNGKVVTFTIASEAGPRTYSAPLAKVDVVKSSDGEEQGRYFIEGMVCVGGWRQPVLFSLNDRSRMHYPVLLGRKFLQERFLVDSGNKFLLGKPHCGK